ncbi:DNA recombination protein RmuC [Nocardioides guangzhouensis]|uniref:DNA recombination protein RmuC n=1 Tax=Nocardioides guangzhouensis TaxID=2497878 RepID=A0A4Q4ZL59_9ACTN|nr:DNA recombination protein RmuC [Nocardioides guangzhouensis]RYP88321.1 DNA recombination protein RmuC [Nocardioides guangzhouensis]
MSLATVLLTLALLATGLTAGLLLGLRLGRSRPDRAAALPAALTALQERAAGDAVIREGLERLQDQLRDLGHDRATWQGQLAQQVSDMRLSTESLRRETQSLSTALRKPQVRGRWGEMHLRRAVELAGLVDRCDFTEQARLEDGALRPDLLVRLAGDKCVVVDAKVPLDAFLDATATDDEDERGAHLARHARQVRQHVEGLSAKRYWRALPESPEFVVLFVPGESFLSAALEADGALIEHAAQRQVVLATPTTLIALLRTVAHGWSHEALADQASEVHRLGRELHERLARMGGHLDLVGRSLGAAVGHYNQAIGALESRVLVSARRFGEMGVTDDELPTPRQVEAAPRSLGADAPEPADDPVARELHAADPPDEGLLPGLGDATDRDRRTARRAQGA